VLSTIAPAEQSGNEVATDEANREKVLAGERFARFVFDLIAGSERFDGAPLRSPEADRNVPGMWIQSTPAGVHSAIVAPRRTDPVLTGSRLVA
jgi:hypothetical protein